MQREECVPGEGARGRGEVLLKNEQGRNDERWEAGRFLLWPTCGVGGIEFQRKPLTVPVDAAAARRAQTPATND